MTNLLFIFLLLLGASSVSASSLIEEVWVQNPSPQNMEELTQNISHKLEEHYGAKPTVKILKKGIIGRAPGREYVTEYFPRQIIVFQVENLAPVMVGYIPLKGSVEFISMDNKDYSFSKAHKFSPESVGQAYLKPVEATRCTTCHQNNGPIFSRVPWGEVDGQERIYSKAFDNFNKKPPTAQEKVLQQFSKVSGELLNAADMDSVIREVGSGLQTQNICKEVCKDNLECRKDFIKFLISSRVLKKDDSSLSQQEAKISNYIKDNWPKDKFEYPTDRLRDKDGEFGEIAVRSSGEREQALADLRSGAKAPLSPAASTVFDRGARLFRVDLSTPENKVLAPFFDPRTPREKAHALTPESAMQSLKLNGLNYCLGVTEAQIKGLHLEEDTLASFFASDALDKILAQDYGTSTALLEAFKYKTSEGVVCIDCDKVKSFMQNTASMFSKILGKVSGTSGSKVSPSPEVSAIMKKRCSTCHDGSVEGPLPVNDLEALRKTKAYEYVRKGKMPERGSPEADEFTSEEMQKLLEAFKK